MAAPKKTILFEDVLVDLLQVKEFSSALENSAILSDLKKILK